jgi:pSer/pThr/pTyr-binding forkhead associated (FHA) protein
VSQTEPSGPRVELTQIDGELSVAFEQGGRVEVGRHESNGLVIAHGSVSRSHAVLEWAPATPYPVVLDQGSSNGTSLDGRLLPKKQAVMFGAGSVLSFGEVEFMALLSGHTAPPTGPALVEDTNRFVTLQKNQEELLVGELETWGDTRNLVLRLEEEQRTGNLSFTLEGEEVSVMVLMGSLRLDRNAAFTLLSRLRDHEGPVPYSYTSEVEIGTLGASWNWRPSELISLLEDTQEGPGTTTRRVPGLGGDS